MTTDIFNLVKITGEDSKKFLQTQITADINELDNLENLNSKILSAYCNQKGRVIAVFYLLKSDDGNYHILTLGNTADCFIKKIKKYAIFSKINFEVLNIEQHLEIFNKYEISNQLSYFIEHKIPLINVDKTEEFLPDNLNLIGLGAVNFKKGCFLGQEIIARVFYKGKTKKKLYKVFSKNNLTNSCTTQLVADNQEVAGHLIIAYNHSALAVIEDRFMDQKLFITDSEISIEA